MTIARNMLKKRQTALNRLYPYVLINSTVFTSFVSSPSSILLFYLFCYLMLFSEDRFDDDDNIMRLDFLIRGNFDEE